MKTKVYNQKGKAAGEVELPKSFDLPWNADLVHQVVVSMQSNQRLGLAHAKMRGEVSGGGKKPWRQKGTGRARHGSTRSPIWRKGGVTHGPRNDRDYSQKINKKMRTKALWTVLASKQREGDLLWLEGLKLETPKTKLAQGVLKNLSELKGFNRLAYHSGNRAIIALPHRDEALTRSFRNLAAVRVEEVRNLNPLDLMSYQHLVLVDPEASLKALETRHK